MGINRRLHDVEVALGLSQETKVEEETNGEYGDIFNHTLYGIHITNKNDALSVVFIRFAFASYLPSK